MIANPRARPAASRVSGPAGGDGVDAIASLFRPVTALRSIGAARAGLLARLLGRNGEPARIVDLLFHMPSGVIDRSRVVQILDAPHREIVTLHLLVYRHDRPARPRAPWRVQGVDETGAVELVFFNARGRQIEQRLPAGERRIVSGRFEWRDGRPQIVHPDRILTEEAFASALPLEPVYPLTEGLTAPALRASIGAALAALPELPEWHDAALRERRGWPGFAEALAAVHRPVSADDAALAGPARERLAYDEMLSSQLALALIRERNRRVAGKRRPRQPEAVEALRRSLPFEPTAGQRAAIEEVAADLASGNRMVRLLQGDVGAGKTLVAAFAAAIVAAGGAQTAMMAPTELLARQHFETFARLLGPVGVDVRLLTGRQTASEADAVRAALAEGAVGVVVGTHALFQPNVAFRDLGLVVVDEQHRFGVHQRLALSEKGERADLLVMTATPIPRTLVLSQLGDMDVSILAEKPAGRSPIDTRAVSAAQLSSVIERLHAAVARGEKAYWICPLVEESETRDVAAATDRHADLERALGAPVGLMHGRMASTEREAVMEGFRNGEIRVLVATTVVEVGVDVPDATIMVIEHAERFGLSQLHQLRGRVGRGAKRSTCVLLYRPPLGEAARARLAIMRETNDGFRIAEEDLRLRGEGEILGTRQSGAAAFRIADLEVHRDLLAVARDDARLVVARDPRLSCERGRALRQLLRLFERREAIRLLAAG